MCLWTSSLTSLRLRVLTCKMAVIREAPNLWSSYEEEMKSDVRSTREMNIQETPSTPGPGCGVQGPSFIQKHTHFSFFSSVQFFLFVKQRGGLERA